MQFRLAKPTAVMAACALLGAGAGIAGSAAAPSKSKSKSAKAKKAGPRNANRGPGGPRFGPGRPMVHSESVVLNRAGDAFITLTVDNGILKSVDGRELTIEQKVGDVAYKTITLTIPENATVRRNHEQAQLSDLEAGDRVHVASSSDGTFVMAHDPSFRPPMRPHHGGPHGPGAPPPPPGG